MPLSVNRKRCLLTALLVAMAAPTLAQSPHSSTISIGDSLSDAGYFRPLLPESVRPVTGQFTTNPGWVWSQQIANYYDTNCHRYGPGPGIQRSVV